MRAAIRNALGIRDDKNAQAADNNSAKSKARSDPAPPSLQQQRSSSLTQRTSYLMSPSSGRFRTTNPALDLRNRCEIQQDYFGGGGGGGGNRDPPLPQSSSSSSSVKTTITTTTSADSPNRKINVQQQVPPHIGGHRVKAAVRMSAHIDCAEMVQGNDAHIEYVIRVARVEEWSVDLTPQMSRSKNMRALAHAPEGGKDDVAGSPDAQPKASDLVVPRDDEDEKNAHQEMNRNANTDGSSVLVASVETFFEQVGERDGFGGGGAGAPGFGSSTAAREYGFTVTRQQKWVVRRRYKAFTRLLQSLKKEFNGNKKIFARLPALPKTNTFRSFNPQYIHRKKELLDSFLASVLLADDKVTRSRPVREFLAQDGTADDRRHRARERAWSLDEKDATGKLQWLLEETLMEMGGETERRSLSSDGGAGDSRSSSRERYVNQSRAVSSDGGALSSASDLSSGRSSPSAQRSVSSEPRRGKLSAFKQKMSSLVGPSSSPPLSSTSRSQSAELDAEPGQRFRFSSESGGGGGDAVLSQGDRRCAGNWDHDPALQLLQQHQPVALQHYTDATDLRGAISDGFVIVSFPQCGMEIEVDLEAGGGATEAVASLTGSVMVNGCRAAFRGSVDTDTRVGTGQLIPSS